jgi:hypothetical protein
MVSLASGLSQQKRPAAGTQDAADRCRPEPAFCRPRIQLGLVRLQGAPAVSLAWRRRGEKRARPGTRCAPLRCPSAHKTTLGYPRVRCGRSHLCCGFRRPAASVASGWGRRGDGTLYCPRQIPGYTVDCHDRSFGGRVIRIAAGPANPSQSGQLAPAPTRRANCTLLAHLPLIAGERFQGT